jgi:hypothetical protein
MYEETHRIYNSFEQLERLYDKYEGFTLAPSFMSWDYLEHSIKNSKPVQTNYLSEEDFN